MATPRRRSSRLRQSPGAQTPVKTPSKPQLAPLIEREETPERGPSNSLNAAATPTTARTPTSTTPFNSSAEEMHPTLFHSALKKQASDHHFGFSSKPTNNLGSHPPQTHETQHAAPSALPKAPQSAPQTKSTNTRDSIASSDYSFTFRHPSTELSSEAQRIMDSVRDEAARIKAQLATQREKQIEQDGSADAMFGGRKMAQAKGKLGRFSDVHMDQFRKMDSIANHASSFRADSSKSVKSNAPTKSLKRTNSKVDLEQPSTPQSLKRTNSKVELEKKDTTQQSLKRTNSKSNIPSPPKPTTPKGLIKMVGHPSDNTPEQGPAKRRKTVFEPEVAAASAPSSSKVEPAPEQANLPQPTSKIPRSPSTKSLVPPSTPQQPSTTAPVPSVPQSAPPARLRDTFVSKFLPFKSILRKPQIKFSNDPLKQAAGTHVAPPSNIKTPEKKSEKHVVFTPEPARVHNISPAHSLGSTPGAKEGEHSPSPTKESTGVRLVGAEKTEAEAEWEDMEVDAPLLTTPAKTSISYPSLAPASAPPKQPTQSRSSMAAPPAKGDFTFNVGPTSHISFASPPPQPKPTATTHTTNTIAPIITQPAMPPPPSPSPTKLRPSILPKTQSQPNFLAPTTSSKSKSHADSPSTPTIRKVRPSTSFTISSPHFAAPIHQSPLKAIDHGLSNKKRKRDVDDVGTKQPITDIGEHDGEKENTPQTPEGSPAKKAKTSNATPSGMAGSPVKGKTPTTLKGREKRMSTLKSPAKRILSPSSRFASPSVGRMMSPGRVGSPAAGRFKSPESGVGSPKSGKKLSWARLEALALPKKRA